MANALYTVGKDNILAGNVDFDANTLKVVLINHATDTPNVSTDAALSDLASGARVATSGALSSKTTTNGVFDAADVTLSTVTGSAVNSLNIYKDSGTENTSYLLVYLDTATGLPFTPSGGDVVIVWDNGSNKIFSL